MKPLISCLWLCAALALALPPDQAAAQGTPKTARVNGVTLTYVERGSGMPVIFVHGGLEDRHRHFS